MSGGGGKHRYRRLLGRRVSREVDDELRFHFDMCVEDLMARGLDPDAAREAALRRLGDAERARMECRTIGQRQLRREARVEMMETVIQDLKQVARGLGRQRAWTAIAVLTIALGIGATSALFTIINAVLLRALPYPHHERIISVSQLVDGEDGRVVPAYRYLAWRDQSKSFAKLAAQSGASTVIQGPSGPEIVSGQSVTAEYFDVLGVPPAFGRGFVPDEMQRGGPRVTVLSDGLWRRAFNADTSLVGRTIMFDGRATTVVGIMPRGFRPSRSAEFWIPLRLAPPSSQGMTFYHYVIGRLRPGADIAGARAELSMIARNTAEPWGPSKAVVEPLLMTLHERKFGSAKSTLWLLFASVGVLLLIACANVSNLLLARAARRYREFGVRIALGASGWRLIRYLLCESLMLSLAGAALGLGIAVASVRYFVHISPPAISNAGDIGVDWMVIGFATLTAAVTGIVFGLVPAWSVRRADVIAALKGASARSSGGRGQSWLRQGLVVTELATALVLLTGAGLLAKSFLRVTSIDSGFDPRQTLVGPVELSFTRYQGPAADAFFDRLLPRIRAIPGVAAVAVTDSPPLEGVRASSTFRITGESEPRRLDLARVSEEYFTAVGIEQTAGRLFQASDRPETGVIINETLARLAFGSSSPLGRTIAFGREGDDVTAPVIGVVRDVRQHGVEAAVTPMFYQPMADDAGTYVNLVVRSTGDRLVLQTHLRAIIRELDPLQPAPALRSLEEVLSEAATPRRFAFVLLGIFAAVAATLAATGLYGVMSYVVAERTNEIGIRVALGASAKRVVRLVGGEGLGLAALAVVLGLAGSLAAVRLLRSMLFEVSIYDPWIFLASALLLIVVAGLASGAPALRAARVDPLTALRKD